MESTGSNEGGSGRQSVVAVAVKGGSSGGTGGRGSRRAIRWALERRYQVCDRFVLIHVIPKINSIPTPSGDRIPIAELDASVVAMYVEEVKSKSQESLIPYRRLCKGRKIETLVVEGDDPASALVRYASDSQIDTLVLGSCSPNRLTSVWKFIACENYGATVPSAVVEQASGTCNIIVVSRDGTLTHSGGRRHSIDISSLFCCLSSSAMEARGQTTPTGLSVSGHSYLNSKASTHERMSVRSSMVEGNSSQNLGDLVLQTQSSNGSSVPSTCTNQSKVNAEVEQLRLELRNAINMYNQACEDLVHTQNKVQMLSSDCLEDAKRINSAAEQEEKFRKIAAEEKERRLESVKEVEMVRNLVAKEAYEREIAELTALKESLEKQLAVDALFTNDKRYKRYMIDEIEIATDFFSESKVIGEGAYGKVYKCDLDGTPVAIKVLWSDTSQKNREFLTEVEVLSQLRHPHMVQLLGACPERGCLIYEYMENRSLEDYISHKTTKPSLSWNTRFRILFEVACALAFLHNSKPDPIVHRDLKPGNILLDRNFVSKIGDVGMAKLLNADNIVPDNVTEYQDSLLAGTMHYIDPEYHRTGTVRPKSDLYAFGVIILQLLTLRPPNGIISRVESAVTCGSLSDILDETVTDWPVAETEELARLGLRCCGLRCRDRPDLDTEVLPLLKRLSEFADSSRKAEKHKIDAASHFYCPILQEVMVDPHIAADGFTYDRIAIQIWLERHDVSPVTKRRLQHKTLTPNHTLRSAIQDWRSNSTSSNS